MPGPLEQALDAVSDEASFLRFVEALAADFVADRSEAEPTASYARGPRGWENGTVDTFLDAAVSWASASRGTQPPAHNVWRRCADILYAGKIYE